MFRVLNCLTAEHDWRLVGLALFVCFIASLAAVTLVQRAKATASLLRFCWLMVAGTVTGWGIWSTHFIAMLAYDPGVRVAYDPWLTSVSLVAAIVLTCLGLWIAIGTSGWRGAALGGTVVGAGVAVMHYLGMYGVVLPGEIAWAKDLVLWSVLAGPIFAAAALVATTRYRGVFGSLIGAILLTGAIVVLHFTAMGAVEIVPDPRNAVADATLSPTALALAIAAIAVALLGISIVAALADRRIAVIRIRDQLTREKQGRTQDQNRRIEAAKMQLDAAINNMPHGLCMFDSNQRLLVCNHQYAELYKLLPEHTAPGTTLRKILERRVATGTSPEDQSAYIESRIQEVLAGLAYSKENELKDGRTLLITHQPMAGGGWVAIHQDVTEQRRAERKIAHMALHDTLTGLPNRVMLRRVVEQNLSGAEDGNVFSVLYLDLDHFKNINDTLGHPVGDALLRLVAERLKQCLRDEDIVARLGGDEFAIVQIARHQPESARGLAQRLLKVMSGAFELEGHQVVIGTSIGIAIAPAHGREPDELLKNADMALYRAKADGRNAFRFFEPAMDVRMRERRSLEVDLREALTSGHFELHYQPQWKIRTREICGFEALLRWNHPKRGMIPPDKFIGVAEDTGLIVDIGAWVLQQACCEAARWPEHIRVAVNLSPVQFRNGDLVPAIALALSTSGISPHRLEVEITEALLLQNSAETISILQQIRSLGVRIALDDFGTGYSSLGYLRKFHVDRIKIDRSFIRDLTFRDDSLAIVRAICGLARDLKMETTAEGVETTQELDIVTKEGCTEIQGFLISRPLAADRLQELLASASIAA